MSGFEPLLTEMLAIIRERDAAEGELPASSGAANDRRWLLSTFDVIHKWGHERADRARALERELEEQLRRFAPLREKLQDTELDLARARDDLEEMTTDRDRLQQILNSAVAWVEPDGQGERPVSARTALIANHASIASLAAERTTLREQVADLQNALRHVRQTTHQAYHQELEPDQCRVGSCAAN